MVGSEHPLIRHVPRFAVALIVAVLGAGCGQIGSAHGSSKQPAAGTRLAGYSGAAVGDPRLSAEQIRELGHSAKRIITRTTTTTTITRTRVPFTPPPNATQAQIAIAAAESQLGVPYVYAAADPGHGFDCSGLTMWAWSEAGVSLPHNAAKQYAALPHVPVSSLQPGDLVFFFSPIEHVGIYIGGGMMIDAPYTGAYVERTGVPWSVYRGAASP